MVVDSISLHFGCAVNCPICFSIRLAIQATNDLVCSSQRCSATTPRSFSILWQPRVLSSTNISPHLNLKSMLSPVKPYKASSSLHPKRQVVEEEGTSSIIALGALNHLVCFNHHPISLLPILTSAVLLFDSVSSVCRCRGFMLAGLALAFLPPCLFSRMCLRPLLRPANCSLRLSILQHLQFRGNVDNHTVRLSCSNI